MHVHTLENWQHSYDFSVKNDKGEQRTKYVLILTAITMVVEIIAGSIYGSMALLADGWHMGTHVAAFMIALFAYRYARKHANNPAYAFGTGKVNVLGGFASAIALAVVALVMLIESLQRIVDPQTIHFNEAIFIASVGLLINVVSAFLLKDDHSHHHHHDHHHDHYHDHDHNLRAAYLHVLADAMTSLLAIVALLSGKYFGWNSLDPIMGVVGAVIITRWSYGLLKQTSPILLDASIEKEYQQAIQDAIEKDSDNKVSDIHIWKVGANHYAAIIALVTHHPNSTEHYKGLLQEFGKLSHVTIEVNECKEAPCCEQEPNIA
ncbi:CDF family Co(II)/Ni(II) efflux transporter DmeF [Thalassomonas viridans]|uniref:CDF family Co(II)/Ni(II) efflux transporter DmeF n=1 Tax=Thalassomonas viridans TaxID=137584 RepID=A0AAE9Z4V5_9GAMM|nr:CDF family Co(II)/Ni(II) efflux transporter DmeF [Thalassomonas viridans]WDE06648.1 CDF family Co(II)/Ni(II) efflux transporter DmeF [Thalassomonas viridans]